MSDLCVFGGSGFVGSEFCRVTKRNVKLVMREDRCPLSTESVYFIGTVDNYNVFEDLHKDIDINLKILVDVIKHLTPGESVFNYISSWFVYGHTDLPATEDSDCHPRGFYSITKRTAEQLLISYCHTFGVRYRILRLGNVYGLGDKGVSAKKNALQYLINRLKNNEDIQLYHNGDFYRDYMHVTDVARAIDLVIEQGDVDQIYNIGSGDRVRFKTVFDLCVHATGSQSKITPVVPSEFHRHVQVKDFYFMTDKLKSLGFQQTISLQKGIEALCR